VAWTDSDLVEEVGGTAVGGAPSSDARRMARRSGGLPARASVQPGTVVLFSDVVCGWATVALHRFRRARERLDPGAQIRIDHRPFLLEVVNSAPVSRSLVDAETAVLGALEPDVGWTPWQGPADAWPVSSLPANEAVQAAKLQGLAASEELDWALRMAFFRDSVCITLHHEIERIARDCASVDADRLLDDLERGVAKVQMWNDHRAHEDDVDGSPHFFLADGGDFHNPGVEFHWNGEPGRGYPVLDDDRSDAMEQLLERALLGLGSD
jgi:predicted DsbA family dithiol-disulfide isomerase